MSVLHFLGSVEDRYVAESGTRWISKYWVVSVIVSGVYLTLVLTGRRWMRDRPKFQLQRLLAMWNTGLALFSMMGFARVAPYFFLALFEDGLNRTVCWTNAYNTPKTSLWGFLFCISKLMELFDTAFVVLRKSELTFLHCYHHCTVLFYSWAEFPTGDAIGVPFCTFNYFVHAVMYSYYAIRATGRTLPLGVSKCITILQLAQFFIAFYMNFLAFWLRQNGYECQLHDSTFIIGVVIYGSYTALFINFFYQRYCKQRTKRC